MNTDKSTAWHERAKRVIPGGVSSPVRAFSAVGGTPRYMVKGAGSHVFDIDGNEYIDLIGSWGPMIVGHAHPHVIEAVLAVAQESSSFGAPSPHEVELAEEITRRISAIEKVRFVSSGTEAVMTAVRLARAATSRDLIVKFIGCYHGHSDALLVQAGSGVITLGLPNSPGVTLGQTQDTITLQYNDAEGIKALFAQQGEKIAAVITEATPANMGVVPPLPGFNKLIADLCHSHGALMILDEVMTGFRISSGGWWSSVESEGWVPDIFTFGKVIGGGYPLAALAGKAHVMDLLAPLGSVYQAGTLSGNPVATTAGLATLQLCDEALYRKLDQRALEIGEGISQVFQSVGIEHSYQSAGNLFSFFFTPHFVNNYEEAKGQNTKNFATFFHSMLENGVSLPPSAFEAWFVNGAMSDLDIEKVLSAALISAKRVAAI
jgi:glutamate-1-semialdehyde 2,1-aminomutase